MSKFRDKIKAFSKKYISPVYLTMLVLALILWYIIKLGYTYTAEVPISVNVAGNKFRVECIAEGTGYRIMAHRMRTAGVIKIAFGELQATPSVINNGRFMIDAHSLQNVISGRVSDLRIISVGELPEIRIPYTEN